MSAPDPTGLLSRIAPVSDEEAARVFGAAGRQHLLDAITRLPSRERPARRRLRRPLVIAAAVVAVAAATGAGWALSHGSARETTSVECVIDGQDTVIDATSGDPAADCAIAWQGLLGKPAPPLQAYDDALGGVTVIPRSQKAPATWTPIASQDVALIELQESLDDYVNGLNSSCFDASAATGFARQQLDRLGFRGWTVDVRPTSQAGRLCYGGFPEPEAKAVTLVSSGPVHEPTNWPPRRLATSLRPLINQCLSLPAMRGAVEQRASSLGLSQTADDERNYQLSATRDDTLRCSTLYETVTGTIHVVLRGPAAP